MIILCVSWIFSAFSLFAQQIYPTNIDHISIAVQELEGTILDFQQLGFTIKPGRLHKNSINNAHIKFADGSALELITASEPKDKLAAHYLHFLKNGDGAAYLALSMKNPALLAKILTDLNPILVKGSYYQWLTFPEESPLSYIFFIKYTSPLNEEKAYFSHENSVSAIQSIMLTKPDFQAEKSLFRNMGFRISQSEANQNHQIVNLGDHDIIMNEVPDAKNDRAIIGVTLQLEEMDSLTKILENSIEIPSAPVGTISLTKEICHGIEVAFNEADN